MADATGMLPTAKKGKHVIMAQGQTANTVGYGLDPSDTGVSGVGEEPRQLKN